MVHVLPVPTAVVVVVVPAVPVHTPDLLSGLLFRLAAGVHDVAEFLVLVRHDKNADQSGLILQDNIGAAPDNDEVLPGGGQFPLIFKDMLV